MIRYLTIQNNLNGASMFAQNFGCFSIDPAEDFESKISSLDPDLLGGFIQTLSGVGTRMFSKDHVQEIGFEGFVIMSLRLAEISVVAVVEKLGGEVDHHEIMEEVAACFTNNFDSKISDWNGDPDKFSVFHEILIHEGFIDATLAHCKKANSCPDEKHCIPRLVRKGTGRFQELADLMDMKISKKDAP